MAIGTFLHHVKWNNPHLILICLFVQLPSFITVFTCKSEKLCLITLVHYDR